MIFMFSFCSLRTNRTVVQKWTLNKTTKKKWKIKDDDSDVQSKAKTTFCAFFVMDPQNSAHAMKSGYNVQMSPVGSPKVLSKNISFKNLV